MEKSKESEQVLVRTGGYFHSRFELFTISRETEKRLYGTDKWDHKTFIDKGKVILRNATVDHLNRVRGAEGERDRRIKNARAWFDGRLQEITEDV